MNGRLPFIFLLVFGWITTLYLISFISGWGELAGIYPDLEETVDQKRRFQSASFRWGMGYNGCLIIGTNSRGLYLSVFFPFRPGHPPLSIPWSDITVEKKRYFGILLLVLKLTKAPSIPVRLTRNLEDVLKAGMPREN